jgi:general bacterial porin, GBP family
MQKKIIALAIAAAAAAPAFAQVTVYGVADAFWATVKVTDNDRYYGVNSAGLSGSRIGFKAVEDLGNGTSALAVIEYGFSMDDGNWAAGSDSGLAARQKLVGLTGGWGTAVAGYAQTAGYDFACGATPFAGSALDPIKAVGTSSIYTAGTVLLSCGNNGRAGNALAYISPNFGGVTFAWNHARLTENDKGATVTGLHDYNDASANLLAATYAGGPVTVNAVYAQIKDSDLALGLAAPVKKVKELGIRGSYNLGFASLFASYQNKDFDVVDEKDTTMTFGAAIPVGPAGTVAVDYARSTLKEGKLVNSWANDKRDSFAVAYLHSLSKRTTAYAGYNRLNDKTGASSVKTDVLAVGLRHSF